MKCTKSQSPQSKLSGSGHAKPGGGPVLLGSVRPLGTSSMCTFQHDFALGGLAELSAKRLAELSAELTLGQLVSSAVTLGAHTAKHLFIQTFPVDQSISGLCSMSQVCLRMMVILPMPVTWKVAHSK